MSHPLLDACELRGASKPERDFTLRWAALGGPKLTREHQFHPTRRWRFDFAHTSARVAIEIDGGMHRGNRGGHTSSAGAARDREKDCTAHMSGWVVFRLTPQMARNQDILRDIKAFIFQRENGGTALHP